MTLGKPLTTPVGYEGVVLMGKTKQAETVLHLFSSDYRPLYLQDCLEILALPTGAIHRFRYDRAWLWLGQQETLDSAWARLAKSKTKVLVHFVAYKSADRYSQSVFVPLRWGTVVRTFVEGNAFFVDFALGSYADPLHYRARSESRPHDAPSLARATEPTTPEFASRRESSIRITRDTMSLLDNRYPAAAFKKQPPKGAFSAVLAPAPAADGVPGDGDESLAFTRLATLMNDLVGLRRIVCRVPWAQPKYSGSVASFFRVVSLQTADRGTEAATAKGLLTVRRGLRYRLRTLHLNTAGLGSTTATVVLPDATSAVSSLSAVIDGKYDVRDFQFSPTTSETDSVGEISITSQTTFGGTIVERAIATTIRMPVLSKPRKMFTAINWVVAVLTGLAAFPLALNALSAIATIRPKTVDGYLDVSFFLRWYSEDGYLAIASGGVLPAAVTALAAFGIALVSLFRRRTGLAAS